IHAASKLRVCMPLETSEYNKLRESLLAAEEEKRTTGRDKPLSVTLRVHGLDSTTWKGTIAWLDESEARYIPVPLSSRGGGPVAVHPPSGKSQGLVPQTQQYMAYIDVVDPSPNIKVGAMAQVKIYCRPETCLHWAWRTVNNVFNLRLL